MNRTKIRVFQVIGANSITTWVVVKNSEPPTGTPGSCTPFDLASIDGISSQYVSSFLLQFM